MAAELQEALVCSVPLLGLPAGTGGSQWLWPQPEFEFGACLVLEHHQLLPRS